jgi:uncharacterized protein YjbJ (UPF0337 family)
LQDKNVATWAQVATHWKRVRGAIRRRWSKLKYDDLEQIQGDRMVLVSCIQERYGISKEKAECQINDWVTRVRL